MLPLEAGDRKVRILPAYVNNSHKGCLSTALLFIGILLGLICLAVTAMGAK